MTKRGARTLGGRAFCTPRQFLNAMKTAAESSIQLWTPHSAMGASGKLSEAELEHFATTTAEKCRAYDNLHLKDDI